MVFNIQGLRIIIIAYTHNDLGTKLRVCSWTWVMACRILTEKPIIIAVKIIGSDMTIIRSIALLTCETTIVWSIFTF
jgi:hypothetical protein